MAKGVSITAIRVVDSPKKPGEYRFFGTRGKEGIAGILFNCPCGCKSLGSVVFRKEALYTSVWTWNGDLERPTVSPSIKQLDCGWHGYLTEGRWETT